MKCKQCSAEFDEHLSQCPYCGELNYIGAEEEYLNHIREINDDMAAMTDDAEEEYKSGFKKVFTVVVGIFCGLILLIGLIFGIILLRYKHLEKQNEARQRAMTIWKNNNYGKLDELYEEGNYDELWSFLDEHANDEGYNPYNWEHMDFLLTYQKYCNFQEDVALFDKNQLIYVYWPVYDALYLEAISEQSFSVFSEKELEELREWQKDAHAFLTDHMKMSEAEITKLKESTYAESMTLPSAEKCKKYIQTKYHLD